MRAHLLVALLLGSGVPPPSRPSVELLRQVAAETALAQVRSPSPAWEPQQRDCAGLVRFAWREAYRRLEPSRLARPLFVDDVGAATDFADARTLVAKNFELMGRGDRARSRLRSGDVLAFRQERPEGEVWHLMMAVIPGGGALSQARVVYHTGEKDQPVRVGRLDELARDAPLEWQPSLSNAAFLGFFRFKEWTP